MAFFMRCSSFAAVLISFSAKKDTILAVYLDHGDFVFGVAVLLLS